MIDIQKEIEKKFPNMDKKENFLKKSLFKIAKKIVHEDSINQFLSQNAHLKGFEFVDAALDYFDFDYAISSNDLQNIPTSGKVVIIANHPLGGLDALCLLRLISQVRKDVKIVEENNKNFLQTSEEMDWIEKLFDLPNSDKNIKYMNATEIIEFIKEKENINKIISADTIGKLMSSKGFRKKTRDNLKKYELILK